MKKSTTARIEDTLDIVADKIIDLEHTAKQMESLKRAIASEITRFKSISPKLDISSLREENKQFAEKTAKVHNQYLADVDKKNKVHRPLYYLILILFLALLASLATIAIMRDKTKVLENRIEWYMEQQAK